MIRSSPLERPTTAVCAPSRLGRLAVGWAAAVALVVLGPTRADAHAFLVRTDPAQGARLAAAPQTVALQFSERVAADGTSISVRIGLNGPPSDLAVERSDGGRVLRATLVARPTGVYVVHWHVVADDGHESDGEFAFAVGVVAGRLPGPHHSGVPSTVAVLGSWLFFVGLALAAGGLVTGLVVDPDVSTRSPSVRAGFLVLLAGAVALYLQSLHAGAPTRQHDALVATVALGCAAMLAANVGRGRVVALAALGGAVVAWSAKGHAASGGAVGLAVDVVHLGAGAVWVGALVHLVARLLGDRRSPDRDQLAVARSYSRLALPLVIVLAAAGGVSALRLLPTLGDLWSTGYGQLILAKSALFAAALALALAARLGLRAGRLANLRRATRVEAGAVGVVLVLTGVLVNVAPPTPAGATSELLGPPPLSGPVVRDAGLAGILTVAVAYGEDQLQVEVLAPGGPVPGTRAELEATLPGDRATALFARPCGSGCLTQRLVLPAGLTRLVVRASAPGWVGGTFSAVLASPPPEENPALLTRLVERMRAVASVSIIEDTTSGPGAHPAPVDYQLSGAAFLSTEPYAGGDANDVVALTDGTGFRLYVAGDRIWVTVWLDAAGRIAREQVVDVGHLIERAFTYPAP